MPPHFVDRHELVRDIRRAIERICQPDASRSSNGFVAVHGMAGNGKSIAVATAIRDTAFTFHHYDAGVFWIPVGQYAEESVNDEIVGLLLYLERLVHGAVVCSEARDKDDLQTSLSKLFAPTGRLRNSIIVLDDVWDDEVLAAFQALECKVGVARCASSAWRTL